MAFGEIVWTAEHQATLRRQQMAQSLPPRVPPGGYAAPPSTTTGGGGGGGSGDDDEVEVEDDATSGGKFSWTHEGADEMFDTFLDSFNSRRPFAQEHCNIGKTKMMVVSDVQAFVEQEGYKFRMPLYDTMLKHLRSEVKALGLEDDAENGDSGQNDKPPPTTKERKLRTAKEQLDAYDQKKDKSKSVRSAGSEKMAQKEAAGAAIRLEGTERAAAGPRLKPRRRKSTDEENGGGGGGGGGGDDNEPTDRPRAVVDVMDDFFKSKAADAKEKTDLEKRKMALQEQQFADERDTKKAKEQAEIEKQRADIAATQANTHLLQSVVSMLQNQQQKN